MKLKLTKLSHFTGNAPLLKEGLYHWYFLSKLSKMFRTAVLWKTQDGCFSLYVSKIMVTSNLCCTEVALYLLQYLLKCANIKGYIFLHGDKNVIIVEEIPWELTEEILFNEIVASWKQMLGINKNPSFPLKNIYLSNLWYPAALGAILTLSFPDNITFLKLLLWLCPISLPNIILYYLPNVIF